MIERLAVFGGTGDLTARYLLPGLAALRAAGRLGDGFRLTGVGRQQLDDAQYRAWVADRLGRHAADVPADARAAVAAAARYVCADVTDPEAVAPVVAGDAPVVAYLALPPALFPGAVAALHRSGLPGGSRVVLEKPFGESLADAQQLNRLLAELLPEQAVFRVDHFLAMTTVQNVLGIRLANRILEPVWNSTHIDEVEIVWDETLALEGRAGYYDRVGALKDMLQNHLLQLLCLVAMEPPVTLGERDLRDRKVDVLRSVGRLTEADAVRRTRRARYLAGRIGDRDVPAYIDEDGVDAQRRTETYAEVLLEIDNLRWSGTTFRLRSGKALGADRKEVAVWFRPVPHPPFGGAGQAPPDVLRFGLEPEGLTLDLTGVGSRTGELGPVPLAARMTPPELPAYGRLLLDVLGGDAALSIRGDEAEEAWRVLEPVLSAWERDLVPLEEYAAGSRGPAPRAGETGRPPCVVVTGVSGSGKSTIAALLAQRLQVPFSDADAYHPPANVAKMRAGVPLDDADRRPWLVSVGGLLHERDAAGVGCVVACSALRRSYRDVLREACPSVRFVALTADRDVIADRMRRRLDHFMPVSLLDSQLAALDPLGADEEGTTIDTAAEPAVVAEIALRHLAAPPIPGREIREI